ATAAKSKTESKKKDIQKESSDATSKSGTQSKFFKRKTNDPPLGDNGNNKKRKVAVVMPKSKECKKPTVNCEYEFLPESAVKSKKSVKKASEISDAKLYKRTKKVQPVKVQVISNERPTKTS